MNLVVPAVLVAVLAAALSLSWGTLRDLWKMRKRRRVRVALPSPRKSDWRR